MGKYDREYEAFQLFEEIQEPSADRAVPVEAEHFGERQAEPLSEPKYGRTLPRQKQKPAFQEAPYYEIEYDSCPMPGVGKFVLKSDKIQTPLREPDPVRERFNQMRDIARESGIPTFSNSKFYDKRIQQENGKLFYRQGMFMKDFEDSCERILPYSAYFPTYQMMGYGQLRTYFTWRTKVRQGEILKTSLSYAFLYLYELLNNIGVESPGEGLEKLMLFWDAYRVYDESIDKYVLKWLKDYHIYYELPWSFQQFVQENHLGGHYPKLSDPGDDFDLYCRISRYDIRKSGFYTQERAGLIKECFRFTLDRLRRTFAESHVDLEDYIFHPTRNMSVWTPFQGALFCPALHQPDRRVVLSEKEIYLCSGSRWTFSTTITTESGRQLIGYAMKQMESVLRRLTKYRHKLSANIGSLSPVMVQELQKDGISLELAVTQAAEAFYREATKTVVKVDSAMLERIRQEALATQERLIVPENGEPGPYAVLQEAETDLTDLKTQVDADELHTLPQTKEPDWQADPSALGNADEWSDLREALTEIERSALALAIGRKTDIKKFADAHGIMLEVLMDGINEKSTDFIGDSILDDSFEVYDDYIEQVKGMVESL